MSHSIGLCDNKAAGGRLLWPLMVDIKTGCLSYKKVLVKRVFFSSKKNYKDQKHWALSTCKQSTRAPFTVDVTWLNTRNHLLLLHPREGHRWHKSLERSRKMYRRRRTGEGKDRDAVNQCAFCFHLSSLFPLPVSPGHLFPFYPQCMRTHTHLWVFLHVFTSHIL